MRLPPSGSSPALCFELAEGPEAHSLLGEAPLVNVINARREFLFAALGSVFPKARDYPPPTLPRASSSPKAAAPKRKPQRKQERRPSASAALQRHVGGVAAPTQLRDVVLAPGAAERQQRGSLVMRVGSALQPQGDSGNDTTLGERVINILTSVPFSLVGLHMLRQRQTPEGRRHAGTLVAVGGAAALYHASSGGMRSVARKLDYWTIAYSASEMIKALFPDNTWARRCATASLVAVPFKPFVVSSVHAAVMEWEFVRQARAHKVLRRDLAIHASTAVLGTAAFFLEDVVKDHGFEHMHGLWHCLACLGVATMNGLLSHNERRAVARRGLGGRGGRKHVHCSATSLADLQHYPAAAGLKPAK